MPSEFTMPTVSATTADEPVSAAAKPSWNAPSTLCYPYV